MMKPGFAASTALRYTRRPYRWACCTMSSSSGSWELAPSVPARRERSQRDRHRDYQNSRRDREPSQRRPSSNPETLLIRRALDNDDDDDDMLYGVNPVLMALQAGRRPHFTGLFTQTRERSAQKGDNVASVTKILKLARELDIPVHEVSKGSLNVLTKDRPHQGLVLSAGKLPVPVLDGLEYSEGVWVALDEVTDPHNAGAIIRSAVFLGAKGVILCRKNCCGVTAAVSKASAGGAEICDIRTVTSMPRFLRAAREDGWKVLGLGTEGDTSIGEVAEKGVVVVVGSEGRGMRTMVRDCCERIVKIPGSGEGVDSLNVSVATGVALFQLLG